MTSLLCRKKLFRKIAFLVVLIYPWTTYAMVSNNYGIPHLQENHGSGFRSSANYQIISDTISIQPVGTSASENYSLTGRTIAPMNSTKPYGGVHINSDAEYTNTVEVTLDLICGDPNGCAAVSISNNGVSWSDPEPYATTKPWTLIANDGERKVYVKYKNGQGLWSGVFSDSIILNTTGPITTISPAGGMFMDPPTVTLTASEPATIYYTTDGSTPTKSSPVYSGPITVSTDTTLKCFAEDLAGNTGPVETALYEVCTGSGFSISGVVTDVTVNKGIPLAIITLDSGQTATTALDGSYSFSNLPRGYYKIVSITTATPVYVTFQEDLTLCKKKP